MPGKILGIDIDHESITAVQVASGVKGYEITSCFRSDFDKDTADSVFREISQDSDLKSDIYFISIPAGIASYRNLKLPFKESKKIRQALPFEIETLVPFPIDDLIIDFNILNNSDQSEILAASVRKSIVSDYLSELKQVGIEPDILDVKPFPVVSWLLGQGVTPECGLYLDMDLNSVSMVLFIDKKIVLIRDLVFNKQAYPSLEKHNEGSTEQLDIHIQESNFHSVCNEIKNTLHSFSWQNKTLLNPEKMFVSGPAAQNPEAVGIIENNLNIAVEQIQLKIDKRIRLNRKTFGSWNPSLMTNALALALRDTKRGHGLNLRKGEFEIQRRYLGNISEIRKAVAFLIIFILFLCFDLGVDYHNLKRRYEMADQETVELFKQAFPEVKNIRFPALQMEQKLDEIENSAALLPGDMKTNHTVLELLRDISERVPESLDIDITSMIIDSETVRITGETSTYDTVDNMKNNLEPSKYFDSVIISSASSPNRTENRINFEIKMQRAQ